MRRLLAILVATLVVATAGCGDDDDGGEALEDRRDELDRADEEDDEAEQPSLDEIIDATIEDVQEYWSEELPAVYGTEYTEVPEADIRTYDESSDLSEVNECFDVEGADEYDDVGPNAFYCPLDQTVTYDIENLFPQLYEEIGPFAVAAVLAHEWGHVVQDQVGDDEALLQESVLVETQADCFTGAWTARVDAGESDRLALSPGDLELGLVGMLSFRDPPGTSPTEPQAHGNGFDRVNAFQEGFAGQAERCSEWPTSPPEITEVPFEGPESEARGGNLPLDQLLEVAEADLGAYWSETIEDYEAPEGLVAYDPDDEDSLPECGDLDLDPDEPEAYAGRTFYCPDDNTVYYDQNLFEVVSGDIGDFGVAVLISNAYAAGVQRALEVEGDPAELGLQADCFSGSWAGSLPPYGTRDSERIESVSPGDLDEVVISFIEFGEDADEGDDPDAASPFERVQAFRTGFFTAVQGAGGVDACAELAGS